MEGRDAKRGVSMVIFPLTLARKNPPCLFLASGGLLSVLGVPQLATIALSSLLPLSRDILLVCLCLHDVVLFLLGYVSYWIRDPPYFSINSS